MPEEVAKRMLAAIEENVKVRRPDDVTVQGTRCSALFHVERFEEKCSFAGRERHGSGLQICGDEEDAIGKSDPTQARHCGNLAEFGLGTRRKSRRATRTPPCATGDANVGGEARITTPVPTGNPHGPAQSKKKPQGCEDSTLRYRGTPTWRNAY